MKRTMLGSMACTVLAALTLAGCGGSKSNTPASRSTLATADTRATARPTPVVTEDPDDHQGPAPLEVEGPTTRPESVMGLEKEERPMGGGVMGPAPSPAPAVVATIATAKVNLLATGAKTVGNLTFTQEASQVVIKGSFTGLPKGNHGFYIYEQADCGKQGRTAAAHFNPTRSKHGPISSPVRHAGDFGNLVVNDAGEASFEVSTDSLKVAEGIEAVAGHTIVIHRRKDDKTGNAGAAIACGVIALQSPTTP